MDCGILCPAVCCVCILHILGNVFCQLGILHMHTEYSHTVHSTHTAYWKNGRMPFHMYPVSSHKHVMWPESVVFVYWLSPYRVLPPNSESHLTFIRLPSSPIGVMMRLIMRGSRHMAFILQLSDQMNRAGKDGKIIAQTTWWEGQSQG